jgi:hypothetical protein
MSGNIDRRFKMIRLIILSVTGLCYTQIYGLKNQCIGQNANAYLIERDLMREVGSQIINLGGKCGGPHDKWTHPAYILHPEYFPVSLGADWKGKDSDMSLLQDLPYLYELTIDCPQITYTGLKYIKGLNVNILHFYNMQDKKEGLSLIKELPSLSMLDINGDVLTDERLEYLENPQIKWLIINGKTKITDAGFVHLKPLKDLFYLKLDGSTLTGKGFAELSELDNLRALILVNSQIDDEGLKYLKGKNLYALDLSGSKVTGPGLKYLNKFKKLRELILDNTPIGDDTLSNLADIKSLEVLSINGTTISNKGIEYLKKKTNIKVIINNNK